MNIYHQSVELKLKDPFGISRGSSTVKHNLIVHLGEGIGEAAPNQYFGDSQKSVIELLSKHADLIPEEPDGVVHVMQNINDRMPGNPAFKAALSMALWDRLGKHVGAPVSTMLGLSAEKAPMSSFTIGISEREDMLRKVADAEEYPVLKIKLGFPGDIEVLRAIREVTDKTIRVDANGGWTAKEAIERIEQMQDLNVEFVEQPCVREDLEGLAEVHKHSRLPIYVDETVCTSRDVPKVAGICDGVNLKLMKCGGLEEGLAVINAARAHGLGVMIGCMIASSVAITAAAHLSPLVDYADLDGHVLISNDPYQGMVIEDGWIRLPDGPGLGVVERGAI